jgi:hypothetical protein
MQKQKIKTSNVFIKPSNHAISESAIKRPLADGRVKLNKMERKTYHIGLWRYAIDYFRAAEILRGYDEIIIDVPAYYLYAHSIELALKALLVYSGSDDKELRKIGHNLKTIWKKAMKKGLNEYLTDFEGANNTIELINPYYQAKTLEYIVPDYNKHFPPILYMSIAAANLIYSVGKAINVPSAQLNKLVHPIAQTTGSG